MTRIALLPILLTSVAMAAEELALGSDEYALTVTHEAKHPNVNFPSQAIPDEDYKKVKKQDTMQLKFSDDWKIVKILPAGVMGKLESADAKKRVYAVTEGLFAGGRLIVESTKQEMTATFTVFGSGVPVISSVRGGLTPEAPNAEKGGAEAEEKP